MKNRIYMERISGCLTHLNREQIIKHLMKNEGIARRTAETWVDGHAKLTSGIHQKAVTRTITALSH